MKKIWNFILTIICLLLVGIVVVSFFEFFNIVEVPKAISLKHIMGKGTSTEVSSNSIEDENIINRNVQYIQYKDEKDIAETTNTYSIANTLIGTEENIYEDMSRFHFNQLSDVSKIIYTELYNNIENLKSGIYNIEFKDKFSNILIQENGTELLTEDFNLAINALTFDNPEIFFINLNKTYLLTQSITYPNGSKEYNVSIGSNKGESYLSDGFQNAQDVEVALTTTRTIRDAIVSRASQEIEDKGKLKVVHDYLVDTISYDTTLSKNNIYNIYGALTNKEAVCEGYARALKYILDELNIPCIIACGTATNSKGQVEDHAWNYVKISNRWYAIDVTWDDPILIGGGNLTDELKYKYFLVGRSSFFTNHKEDGFIVGDTLSFEYPVLNLTDY